jgi:ribosomal-protein-serine acetyltransferase
MFRCQIDTDIELRLFEERHAADIFAAVERNRSHLRRWLPWVDRTQSADDVRAFLEGALEAFGRGEELHAGIWIAGALGGAVGHHRIDADNRSTSIGYWLDAAHEGKGIITRACRALLGYLFDERGLHRVEIRCATGNTRSCAIPERLGFTREGVARGAELVNGVFYDLVVWSMLEDQWRSPIRR